MFEIFIVNVFRFESSRNINNWNVYLQEESSSGSPMQVHRTSSDISLDKLINLSGRIYNLCSEKDSRDLRIAGQLFDACNILKENPLNNWKVLFVRIKCLGPLLFLSSIEFKILGSDLFLKNCVMFNCDEWVLLTVYIRDA